MLNREPGLEDDIKLSLSLPVPVHSLDRIILTIRTQPIIPARDQMFGFLQSSRAETLTPKEMAAGRRAGGEGRAPWWIGAFWRRPQSVPCPFRPSTARGDICDPEAGPRSTTGLSELRLPASSTVSDACLLFTDQLGCLLQRPRHTKALS